MKQKQLLESTPAAARDEEKKMLLQSSNKEIESLKMSLVTKSQEVTSLRARCADLETRTSELVAGVRQQQEVMQSIHDEYREQLESVETRHRQEHSIGLSTSVLAKSINLNTLAYSSKFHQWSLWR